MLEFRHKITISSTNYEEVLRYIGKIGLRFELGQMYMLRVPHDYYWLKDVVISDVDNITMDNFRIYINENASKFRYISMKVESR